MSTPEQQQDRSGYHSSELYLEAVHELREHISALRQDIQLLREELRHRDELLHAAVSQQQESPPPDEPSVPQEGEQVLSSGVPANSEKATYPEKGERITITGRLRDAPHIWERNHQRGAWFDLASPQPEGETTWHRVIVSAKVFPRVERRLMELQRGDITEVVGARHERIVQGRHGPRREPYISAFVLRTPKAPSP